MNDKDDKDDKNDTKEDNDKKDQNGKNDKKDQCDPTKTLKPQVNGIEAWLLSFFLFSLFVGFNFWGFKLYHLLCFVVVTCF